MKIPLSTAYDLMDEAAAEKDPSLETGLAHQKEVPDYERQERYSRKTTHGNNQED